MKKPLNELNSQDLIQKKSDEVQANLKQHDFFEHYIIETLNNFAFRYFDQPKPAQLINHNLMNVQAIELGIKEAIKIKNPALRLGIADLVKRVSKEQGPTILREIRVKIDRTTGHAGNCQVTALISFGHPEHDLQVGSFVEKVNLFSFDDEINFRNILARHLELICDLF